MSSWPHTFGTQYPSVNLSWLDDQFNQITSASTSTVSLAGAALVGFIHSVTGSVTRNSQAKIRESWISVKDLGAKGDGTTDDTAAIQAAIDAAAAATAGCVVYFPPGRYLVTASLVVNTSYVRLLGAYPNVNNTTTIGSCIYTSTSGIGDLLLVHKAGSILYGVKIEYLMFDALAGLGAAPNGIRMVDVSEFFITECEAGNNLADGLQIDGSAIGGIDKYKVNSPCVTGLHLKLSAATQFVANDTIWMREANIFNTSTAAVLIEGATSDLTIRDSWIESTPAAVLVQNPAGATSGFLLDKLTLDSVTNWNSTGDNYTDTRILKSVPLLNSSTVGLRLSNISLIKCKSFQNKGSAYHVELTKNGNTETSTGVTAFLVDGGEYYSATTAIVTSDLTAGTDGYFRGPITALNGYQTGSAISLRNGTGMITSSGNSVWNTQERSTFTPTDASGAGLSLTSVSGYWTREGTIVTFSCSATYPVTANTASVLIGGLPYAAYGTTSSQYGGAVTLTDAGISMSVQVDSGTSVVGLWTTSGVRVANNQLSGKTVRLTASYQSE